MKQYKTNEYSSNKLHRNTSKEGETIEQKLARIKASKQPIKDGIKPIIHTPRADGVHPAYNIRTNKMEVALEAKSMVDKARQAKRGYKPKNGGPESTDGKPEQNDAGGAGTTGQK